MSKLKKIMKNFFSCLDIKCKIEDEAPSEDTPSSNQENKDSGKIAFF